MTVPSPDRITDVKDAVANRFPRATDKSDSRSLNLKWQLPKSSSSTWSATFSSCLEMSQQTGVANFCLTQASLQDIFLMFAETKETLPQRASVDVRRLKRSRRP